MFLDNPNFYSFIGPSCYCCYCQAAFREESGGKPEWVVLPLGIGEPFEETVPGRKLVIASTIASGGRPMVWAQEVSIDPKQTGLGTTSIYTVPEVSEALRAYYRFLKCWEDYLFDAQAVSDGCIQVENYLEGVLVSAYRKDRAFILHLVNLVGASKTQAPVPQDDIRIRLQIPFGVGIWNRRSGRTHRAKFNSPCG